MLLKGIIVYHIIDDCSLLMVFEVGLTEHAKHTVPKMLCHVTMLCCHWIQNVKMFNS